MEFKFPHHESRICQSWCCDVPFFVSVKISLDEKFFLLFHALEGRFNFVLGSSVAASKLHFGQNIFEGNILQDSLVVIFFGKKKEECRYPMQSCRRFFMLFGFIGADLARIFLACT